MSLTLARVRPDSETELPLRPAQTDRWLTAEILELAHPRRVQHSGMAAPRAHRVARWMNHGPDGLEYDFTGASSASGVWAVVRQGCVRGGCIINPPDTPGHGALWWPAPFALEPDPAYPGVSSYVGTISETRPPLTIARIWIHPASRRQGWGRRLVETVAQRLAVPPSALGWQAPLTAAGQVLAQRCCPDGIWLT